MASIDAFKAPVCIVSTTIVVAVCLVFYLGVDLDGLGESSWLHPILRTSTQCPQQEPSQEVATLARVLEKASMENRTVIITTLNGAWAAPNSIIDLFLESFRIGEQTQPLLKHLLIVALDRKAFNRCRSIHPHCFLLTINGTSDFSEDKRYLTPDYTTLLWERIHFLIKVLQLGYNFVFTDADVMWLRNPFKHLSPSADLTISCDSFMGNSSDLDNFANGGFTYVKSCYKSIEFYKYWYWSREEYRGAHDQYVFDIIKRSYFVKFLRLKIRFLGTAFFGGFCQPSRDLNKVCTMHANCCVGLETKLHDLQIVIDGWKNFTMLPPENKSGEVYWTVPIPNKCRV